MNSGDGSKQSDLKQALRGRELPIVKLCVYRFLSIRSLELQILSFIEEPRYPNLIDKRTDISQKDENPIKKRQNRTRDGKENKCSGSNINRPELAFEVCPILPAIPNPLQVAEIGHPSCSD
ncbi:hypothetical protein Tco_0525328 [Tanacetum coccineum]